MINSVGIIGMGDMGKLYAKCLSLAGYSVNVCDLPLNFEKLSELYADSPNIRVFKDGFQVSRCSDFIIYSVEAAHIHKCVEMFGPATKVGAIVAGQTSVKEPEIKAFESFLPPDVHIVSCHSLHGPSVNPQGQPLVIIRHRANDAAFAA